MVDATVSLLTLPLDVKGHHVGSRGNGISVGFEICEPANIAYKDKYHTEIDTEKYDPNNSANRADFFKRYNNAVELAAFMCRQTGVKPENVICHKEAARKGIATGHADVLHWFPLFGKSMDDFRRDVATHTVNENKDKKAACYKLDTAYYRNECYNKAYKVNAIDGLNVRVGAGIEKQHLCTLEHGSTFRCYGYYNKAADGSVWLYGVANNITGYCNSAYLK